MLIIGDHAVVYLEIVHLIAFSPLKRAFCSDRIHIPPDSTVCLWISFGPSVMMLEFYDVRETIEVDWVTCALMKEVQKIKS